MNLRFTEAPDSEISLPKSAEERSQIDEIKKVREATLICKYHAASHWSEKDRLIGWKNNQSESLLYFNPNRFPTIRCELESPNYPPRWSFESYQRNALFTNDCGGKSALKPAFKYGRRTSNKMVRETRHLWVGNLPENIREEEIVKHFAR